jgi:hypothetical protein
MWWRLWALQEERTAGKGCRSCFPEKIKKRSWNVIDNKALPFLELGESWNVYESK